MPGVKPAAERTLWELGAATWDHVIENPQRFPVHGVQPSSLARVLKNSEQRLRSRDHTYFRKRIPQREHWRVFPEWEDRLLYLDIETDGGWAGSSITMIGCYDGRNFRAFIKGKDLDAFPKYLENFGVLVTFFGSGFDIPMLKRLYFTLPFDQMHIDLCPAMRRLGYRSGLKKIERELGIARDSDTDGLTGRDAIMLWKHYSLGDKRALDLLVRYNAEDVVNMKTIMKFAYKHLRRETLGA